ncbi:increased DNA methylation 2 isoform X3 [Pyrus x bretschneideri]|uniref:increased DNA methylation 2 isoform X3 n=1 Tax=Pyrus x bretschneideri TaxID=225117 RepID=UPI00202E2FB0|nr:increased DNA methylation 2 isoform X3 [Pyrus x bretschneideri]
MDGSSQATGSNPASGLDFNNFQSRMANDDQRFLLYFIIGTYFGPDLKGERPSKSVLQRIAERLPPYTIEQLGGSCLKMAEVEQVYYYVLRKADQSAIAKLPLLSQFFHGSLRTHREDATANYPQFTDLFPLLLHPHSQFNNKDDIFENIVFIHNPEIYYIKPKDIERFKRLTGLEDFLLDRDAAKLHTVPDGSVLYNVLEQEPKSNAATRDGFALTGSAAMAKVGPTIGLIDIGECDDSYLFRVSLPGVRRDEREFSCEVENEGQVLIRGVAVTGEKTVHRYSQMFEMQTQNLCPSGQFSISFQLPGPVNPQQFSGNFGTDGILEGIVMKRKDVSSKYA